MDTETRMSEEPRSSSRWGWLKSKALGRSERAPNLSERVHASSISDPLRQSFIDANLDFPQGNFGISVYTLDTMLQHNADFRTLRQVTFDEKAIEEAQARGAKVHKAFNIPAHVIKHLPGLWNRFRSNTSPYGRSLVENMTNSHLDGLSHEDALENFFTDPQNQETASRVKEAIHSMRTAMKDPDIHKLTTMRNHKIRQEYTAASHEAKFSGNPYKVSLIPESEVRDQILNMVASRIDGFDRQVIFDTLVQLETPR